MGLGQGGFRCASAREWKYAKFATPTDGAKNEFAIFAQSLKKGICTICGGKSASFQPDLFVLFVQALEKRSRLSR